MQWNERVQETTLGEMIILTTEDNNLSYEMLQNWEYWAKLKLNTITVRSVQYN